MVETKEIVQTYFAGQARVGYNDFLLIFCFCDLVLKLVTTSDRVVRKHSAMELLRSNT